MIRCIAFVIEKAAIWPALSGPKFNMWGAEPHARLRVMQNRVVKICGLVRVLDSWQAAASGPRSGAPAWPGAKAARILRPHGLRPGVVLGSGSDIPGAELVCNMMPSCIRYSSFHNDRRLRHPRDRCLGARVAPKTLALSC